MLIKACIFDFDGTLIDSEKYHHEAWQKIALNMGTDLSYEEYLPLKSAGRQVVIPYLLKKAGFTVTDELYKKYYDMRAEEILKSIEKLNENDVMKGAIDFINLLKNNGIFTAVASSSAAAHVVAKRFEIFDYFDVFVDGEAKLPNKPQPDIFLHTARLLGVEPRSCVVFEDSINGLKGGKAANMKVIGLQTYFTDLADKIIDDFSTADLKTIEF